MLVLRRKQTPGRVLRTTEETLKAGEMVFPKLKSHGAAIVSSTLAAACQVSLQLMTSFIFKTEPDLSSISAAREM